MELELPALSELLKTHKEDLQQLRKTLNTFSGDVFDDLFLLRYLLSFGGPGHETAEAVIRAQDWREKYKPLVKSAKANASFNSYQVDSSALKEYMSADDLATLDSCLLATFTVPTKQPPDFLMYVIHSGKCKLLQLMNNVSAESVGLWLTWRNEIGFWRCDAASRLSGRLIKQIVVMDMAESKFMQQDPRFFIAYGNSSKRASWLHPQLLARNIVVNPPSYMNYFWALGRRLASQRLLKKVHVHNGVPKDYLQQYYGDALPEHFQQALNGAAAGFTYHKGGNLDTKMIELILQGQKTGDDADQDSSSRKLLSWFGASCIPGICSGKSLKQA